MKNRIFKYDGRGRKADFNVSTKLTDAEAIDHLTGGKGITPGTDDETFQEKCAFEINKQANGFRARENMVAWGFKLAEEKAYPRAVLTINPDVAQTVRFRKPLYGEVEGEPFKIQLAGPNSRHCGSLLITDGGPFRKNRYYGRADQNDKGTFTWKPTRETPACVIAKLAE
jgi:hypothetical protein